MENPHIGIRKVERILDAAHSLSMNCRRYASVKKAPVHRAFHPGQEEESEEDKTEVGDGQISLVEDEATPDSEKEEKIPTLEPDEDILLFIRDNNRKLTEWQRDLLTIVHEEAQYFIPQIETKIMNEGWASYWHKKIMDSLDLDQDMRMEFMVRHNQVLRPIPRSLNPYHMGFKMFEDIFNRWENPTSEEQETFKRSGGEGHTKIFQIRETDRDESFIRQYLTRDLMIELDLYQHDNVGGQRVVTRVASEDEWKELRNAIIRSVGMNSFPVIKVQDADFDGLGKLLIVHEFEERELDRDYAQHTLNYLRRLWGKPVILETRASKRKVHMICEEEGKFEIKEF